MAKRMITQATARKRCLTKMSELDIEKLKKKKDHSKRVYNETDSPLNYNQKSYSMNHIAIEINSEKTNNHRKLNLEEFKPNEYYQ